MSSWHLGFNYHLAGRQFPRGIIPFSHGAQRSIDYTYILNTYQLDA